MQDEIKLLQDIKNRNQQREMRNGAIVLNTFMRKLQVVDIGGTRRTMRKRKFCHKSALLSLQYIPEKIEKTTKIVTQSMPKISRGKSA